MSTVNSVTAPSVTLATLKADNQEAGNFEDATSTLAAYTTQQVSADTTVTTLILTSTDSRLPNLSLEDILGHSGVDDDAVVTLEQEELGEAMKSVNESMAQTGLVKSRDEQIQQAIDTIEEADTVIVEVETTNNVQTVTVRAADIETAFTQASVKIPGKTNPTQSNYLLLTNGWAYTNLETSPLDLSVGPAEEAAGNGWAVWRSLENGVYEIQDAVTGLWNELTGLEVDISPKTPADVTGKLSFIAADVQISSTTTTTTTLQLSPEGVFTNTRSSLTTNGDVLPDVFFALQSVSSAKGTGSQVSTTPQTTQSQSAVADGQQQLTDIAGDMFGAYRILEDGMTLEMHFADGSVTQQLYLQVKDSPESLSVGGQQYFRQGDAVQDLLGDLMRIMTASEEGMDIRGLWLKGLTDAMRNTYESRPVIPASEQHLPNIPTSTK